jgi:hypothetical protein
LSTQKKVMIFFRLLALALVCAQPTTPRSTSTTMSVLCFLFVALCVAQRVVLFNNSDARGFSLLQPDDSSGTAVRFFFTPLGALSLTNNSLPRLLATRASSEITGRHSGIVTVLWHIALLPPISTTIAIDLDYTVVLTDSGHRLTSINHGTNHILMLASDEDRIDDPRGLAIEYGGGNLLPPDGRWGNWTDPRVAVWRFETLNNNGIASGPLTPSPTAARNVTVRSGRFRIRARFLLGLQTLDFEQLSISVENNVNFTGLLLHFRPPFDSLRTMNATSWLLRDPLKPPRIFLFGTRTDFEVQNLVITAEPASTAPSFNSTWLSVPPTPPPVPVITIPLTPKPTPAPTPASTTSTSGPLTTTTTTASSRTTSDITNTTTRQTLTLPDSSNLPISTGSSNVSSSTASSTLSTSTVSGSLSTGSPGDTTAASDTFVSDSTTVVGVSGGDQTTIIAVAIATPTILLCLLLAYLGSRRFGGRAQKHGTAQVLSTSEHKTISAANKEFQSMREMQSIYSAAPALRDAHAHDVDVPRPVTLGGSNVMSPPSNDKPVRTSDYGPISARDEYSSVRGESHYATSVQISGQSSSYGALMPAECSDRVPSALEYPLAKHNSSPTRKN